MKPDDCTVDDATLGQIREHVERALRDSESAGVFPTPVDRIVAGAQLSVEPNVSLDEGFFAKLYRGAGHTIKKAVSKVIGLLDVGARCIYLDQTLPKPKKAFVTLHETGHHALPWQRDTYAFLEDSKESLDLDLKEQFEREANVFASEVLFQGERYAETARERPFGIKAPIDLAKLFGASMYASLRKYVATNAQPCVLLVYEPPATILGQGYGADLRRVISSTPFSEQFGEVDWPDRCTKTTFLSPLLFPRWTLRESMKCSVSLDGVDVPCRVDAFNTGRFGYYVLLFPENVRPPRRGKRAA